MNIKIAIEKDQNLRSVYTNMILFLSGKMVSMFGARMMKFAIGLYVLNQTGSGISFALTMVVAVIPAVIISPFAGALADRWNRKMVVVISDMLCGLVLIIIYLIARAIGLSLNMVLITVFLLSVLNTFFYVTMDASIPNIVDKKRLTKINSYNSAIMSLASIGGPAMGGMIYAWFPIEMFLMVAGVCFLISAFTETFINFNFNNLPGLEKSKEKVFAEIKLGYDYLKKKKVIFSIFIVAVVINFVFSGYTVALPHIINVELNLSSEAFGLIQSSFAIGSLIFSVLFSLIPNNKSKYHYLITALVFVSILMMITGIPTLQGSRSFSPTQSLLYFIMINFSVGGALMFLNLPILILIQRLTLDEYRGRVNGLLSMMTLSIQPLGMILGGLFVDYISSFGLVLICGMFFLATSISFVKIKGLKESI